MTILAVWVQTAILALAVILIVLTWKRPHEPNRLPMLSPGFRVGRDALGVALDCAQIINAYDGSSLSDPGVHLEKIARLKPRDYEYGAREIPRHFKDGRVVSVDLGALDVSQAARLVDFCSGLLCGSPGWIFRVTDSVIVLTPILN